MNYRYVNQKFFSRQEVIDLLKSTIAITIAFSILFYNSQNSLLLTIMISLLGAGSGFFLHELAHKYFAIRFGAKAEFRSDDKMLLLAIATSLFGFVFAAPGAVMIAGSLNKKLYGIVSLSGPFTNMLLAVLFFGLSFLHPIFIVAVFVNVLLFVFNMIPLPPFDGAKVYSWDKTVYFIFAGLALLMFVTLYF